jgi:hypothetical protein
MIKKIFLIMLLSVILNSCGVKNCPKNNQEKKKCDEIFIEKE